MMFFFIPIFFVQMGGVAGCERVMKATAVEKKLFLSLFVRS